jgi:hypothetical protein
MIRKLATAAVLVALGASFGGTRVVQTTTHRAPAVATEHVVGYFNDASGGVAPYSGGGWLLTSTGTVSVAGLAQYHGDLAGDGVTDIVGMVGTTDGHGYWLVGADGGVFAFGDAPYLGSLPGDGIVPSSPIAGIGWCNYGNGYVLVSQGREAYPFGCSN